MTRRDRMLAQMGITQWTLRAPQVLKGELSVQIPETARLLIITDELIDLTCDLLSDIFRAMNISIEQVYCIDAAHKAILPKENTRPCWLLGIDIQLPENMPVFNSPYLSDLYQDAKAKKKLWTQIYQNDDYFCADKR